MKAEDTIMSWEGIRMILQEQDKKGQHDNMFRLEAIAQAQAEISLKAGKKFERQRLVKKGLFTEKQWIFKIHNGLKASAQGTFAMLLTHIHEKECNAGRRDVVEWIENHPLTVHSGTAVDGLSHYEIDYSNLKAKLKEWGIKDE